MPAMHGGGVVFGWGEFHSGLRTHFDWRRVRKVGEGDNPSERGREGENLHATRVRRPFSTPTPHKSTRANICADAALSRPSAPLVRIKEEKERGRRWQNILQFSRVLSLKTCN